MLVELVQIKKRQGRHYLSKIYLNPRHIVYISEDVGIKNTISESNDIGLVPETTFSTIRLNDNGLYSEISVVGDPQMIESKIFSKKRRDILRG